MCYINRTERRGGGCVTSADDKRLAGWRPLLAAEAKRSPFRLVGRAGRAGRGGGDMRLRGCALGVRTSRVRITVAEKRTSYSRLRLSSIFFHEGAGCEFRFAANVAILER